MAKLDPLHQSPLYYVSALTLTQIPLHQPTLSVLFWSLCFEVAFYLIVLIAIAVTPRGARSGVILNGLNTLTIAALIWMIVSRTSCPFPLMGWPMFGLGILIYHTRLEPDSWSPRVCFSVVAALILVFAVRNWNVVASNRPNLGMTWCFTLGFALLLLGLSPKDERVSNLAPFQLMAWVGAFSYSLYLTHAPLLGAWHQLVRRLGWLGEGESFFWVQFLITIVLAIAFARLFFAVCERPFLGK